MEGRAYQQLPMLKTEYFHQPIGRYEYSRVYYTPYRTNVPPFPSEVAISEY